MSDSPPSRLIVRGNPTGPRIYFHSQAYTALSHLIRITTSSASIGALIGTAEDGAAEAAITVLDAQPIRLVQSGGVLLPDRKEWRETVQDVQSDSQLARRVVGWYYVGPGSIDVAQVQRALLPEARVLLLVNLAVGEGAFYAWRNDGFEPTNGFYEVLGEGDSAAVVPWTGQLDSPKWASLPLSASSDGAAASLAGYSPDGKAAEAANAAAGPDSTEAKPSDLAGPPPAENEASSVGTDTAVAALIDLAGSFEAQGNTKSALATYGHALRMTSPGSRYSADILRAIDDLEKRYFEPELAATDAPPPAPDAAVPPTAASQEEPQPNQDADLASLFDAGLQSYEQDDWARAEQFFSEVVAREPGYTREGRSAEQLLESSRQLRAALVAYHEGGWSQAREVLAPIIQPETGDQTPPVASAEVAPVAAAAPIEGDEPEPRRTALWAALALIIVLALLAVAIVPEGGPLHRLILGARATPFSEVQPLTGGPNPTVAPTAPLAPSGVQAQSGQNPAVTASAAVANGASGTGSATAPQPSPTLAALAPAQDTVASPTAAPTATAALSADALRQQVAAAEAAVHSGQLQATISNGGTTASVATMSFDLGDSQHTPRYYLTVTYHGSKGPATTEYLVIGNHSYQRVPGKSWQERAGQEEGPWGQVHTYLPGAAQASNPQLQTSGASATLHWYDTQRDADVTLQADPATGVPLSLQQVSRSNGSQLSVVYKQWNTPVQIPQP